MERRPLVWLRVSFRQPHDRVFDGETEMSTSLSSPTTSLKNIYKPQTTHLFTSNEAQNAQI